MSTPFDAAPDVATCPSPAIASNTLRYGFDSMALTVSVYTSSMFWSLHGVSAKRNVAAYFEARPTPGLYEVVGSLPTSPSNAGLYVSWADDAGVGYTLDAGPYGCVNVVEGSDGKLEISFSHVLFSSMSGSETNYADARMTEP